MPIGWRQQRQLRRKCEAFCALLERRNPSAALTYYEVELSSDEAHVEPTLQALYHFHGWLASRKKDHLAALARLTNGAPSGSDIPFASEAARWLERLNVLARLVRDRSSWPGPPPSPGDQANDAPVAALEALERLANAVITSHAAIAERVAGPADPKQTAQTGAMVLAALPSMAALKAHLAEQRPVKAVARPNTAKDQTAGGPLAEVAAHLRTWAAFATMRPEDLDAVEQSLDDLPPAIQARVRRAVLARSGAAHVASQAIDRALEAQQRLAGLDGEAHARDAVIAWGTAAIETNPAAAVVWLGHLAAFQPPLADTEIAYLGWCVAQIRAGDAPSGRAGLARFAEQPAIPDGTAAHRAGQHAADRYWVAQLLAALSLLATTRDWPRLDGDPTADVDRRVKNQALWGAMKTRLAPLVATLKTGPPRWSTWGHLLAGLMAYVDRGAACDAAIIEALSVATESVTDPQARTRLREIEAALTSRAMACEQTMALIQQSRHKELRDFKTAVLDQSDIALPPLVRAAVYMTLGQGDPGYDPLPDLKRIDAAPAEEALIGQCIAEAQLTQALRRLRTQCLGPPESALPALEAFAGAGTECQVLAATALTVCHIKNGDAPAAERVLAMLPAAPDRGVIDYMRFVAAWQTGNLAVCEQLLGEARLDRRFIHDAGEARAGLIGHALVRALGDNDPDRASTIIAHLSAAATGSRDVAALLINLVVWHLRRGKGQLVRRFVGKVLESVGPGGTAPRGAMDRLAWTCRALEPLLAAQAGQYAACADSAQLLFALPLPGEPVLGSAPRDARLVAWCRLFRVMAELGMSRDAPLQDRPVRWRSAHRALEEQRDLMLRDDVLVPYVALLDGLFTYVSSDAPVEEDALVRLSSAQRGLALSQRAQFLEAAIGKLTWRRKVLADFWGALKADNTARARLIHQEELAPVFGVRMPPGIELAMIVIECGSGAANGDALLARLNLLTQRTTSLSADLVARARSVIEDARMLRRLTDMLKNQQFEHFVETVERSTWTDMKPGSFPIELGVAMLYAYFKLRNSEQTEYFASLLTEPGRFEDWVHDYGALLLGYVQFENKEYPKAVEMFGQITTAEAVDGNGRSTGLLGHDVTGYRAAAQFNHGLQLMAVHQKEKAFEVFSRALSRRNQASGQANLTDLFLHFGLEGLQKNQGLRARQAFELAVGSLEAVPSSPDTDLRLLLASLGIEFCDALMAEDIDGIGGDRFIGFLDRLGAITGEVDPVKRASVERTIRIVALCQELRRYQRMLPAKRARVATVRDFLLQQHKALEALEPVRQSHDPLLRVLKGLIDLLLMGKATRANALCALEQAFKLGAQSPALGALLDRQRDVLQTAMARSASALDLFDVFVASGNIPPELEGRLVRDDDLSELYRINRGYVPGELISEPAVPAGVKPLCSRIEALADFTGQAPLSADADVRRLGDEMKRLIADLKSKESELLAMEVHVMEKVSQALKSQAFETAPGPIPAE